MPQTKKPRHRPGCVMVKLTPEERTKLDAIKDRLAAKTTAKVTLDSTLRHLIREAK